MFRVSPWITYDPAPEARQEGLTRTNNHFYNMPDDVEMDAPQIDTLREEETPEPQPTTPARTSKFRVKLLVNETKTKKAPASSSRKQTAQNADSEDDDDDDDEEDQLIDDDEEETKTAVPSVVPSPEKRGTAAKRGTTTTGRGRGRGGGRRGRGQGRGGPCSSSSGMAVCCLTTRLLQELFPQVPPRALLQRRTSQVRLRRPPPLYRSEAGVEEALRGVENAHRSAFLSYKSCYQTTDCPSPPETVSLYRHMLSKTRTA